MTGRTHQAGTEDSKAPSKIMPVVYDELRRLARRYLKRERAAQSLQATELVNEAYLRLVKDKTRAWQNRTHFLAIAATSMRQILVERARARTASKRGGSKVRITLDDAIASGGQKSFELLSLDEALNKLGDIDQQQARIVEPLDPCPVASFLHPERHGGVESGATGSVGVHVRCHLQPLRAGSLNLLDHFVHLVPV